MTEKKLGKLIEELRSALDATQGVDEKGRALLRDLDREIRELLERSEGVASNESVLERLQEAINHFEVTHPDLTSVMANLLNLLSNAGI